MFTLKVKYGSKWVMSINTYESREAAEARIAQLEKVGIKAKIIPCE